MATAYGATAREAGAGEGVVTAPRTPPSRASSPRARPPPRSPSRDHVAVARRQRLPFEGQQAMALEVAERPVVGRGRRSGTPSARRRGRACAAGSRARRRRRRGRGGAPRRRACARAAQELVVRQRGDRVERGGDDLHLALGVEVGEHHLGARLGLDAGEQVARPPPRVASRVSARYRSTRRRAPGGRRGARNAGITSSQLGLASGRRSRAPRPADGPRMRSNSAS